MVKIKLCEDCSINKKHQWDMLGAIGKEDNSKKTGIVQADFTLPEIYKLLKGYHEDIEVPVINFQLLHMSPDFSGDKFDEVKGAPVFTSIGPVGNRMFADYIDDHCTELLGESAEARCDILEETVRHEAAPSALLKALAEAGSFLLHLAGTFLIFGPALLIYHRWSQNRNGGGGNSSGTNAGGGSGGGPRQILLTNSRGVVTGTHTVKSTRLNPADQMLANARAYLSRPDVQADIMKVRVAIAPAGVKVPAGHVVVSARGGLYFMPRTALPRINIGSIVRVNVAAFRANAIRFAASPVR